MLPDALPAGAGPLVDNSSTASSIKAAPHITTVTTAAPAGPGDVIPGSPRAMMQGQPMDLPRSAQHIASNTAIGSTTEGVDTYTPTSSHSSSSGSKVVAVAPEKNLYGIRRPISPGVSPRSASPALSAGPAAAPLEASSPHHQRRYKK
jgi:hypothetical protein